MNVPRPSSGLDLTPYVARDASAGLSDRQRNVLVQDSTFSTTIYGDTVDGVFFDELVVLCEATAEYLYNEFTPSELQYVPGSRPHLEKIVRGIIKPDASEREKALALMRYCRDLPNTTISGQDTLFHGGTEEEVIKKCSGMCNEQSRVLIVLAQIAGIPARYVGHVVPTDFTNPKCGTGHGVCELRVEDTWMYLDIRGKYFLSDDGSLATAWDLLQDPTICDRQGPGVRGELWKQAKSSFSRSKDFFAPDCVSLMVNYFVWDWGRYDYGWIRASDETWDKARHDALKHGNQGNPPA